LHSRIGRIVGTLSAWRTVSVILRFHGDFAVTPSCPSTVVSAPSRASLEVIAKGSHIVILVNGMGPTNNRWNKRDTYRNGAHIAFEQNRDSPPVEIRRIEIKEFAASKG
jgi:hypothetical protein